MKKLSKLSLKIELPSLASVVLGILLIVATILIVYTTGYKQISSDYLNRLTDDYARQIESKMTNTLSVAETVSHSIESIMRNSNVTREDVLALVNNVLKNHQELVGIGVGFEPNAFDQKDEENIGKKHSDDTGRFVPYTYREGGKIDYTILSGYDDPGPDGSWYSVPKSTNKTYATSPYWYEVSGEQYLIFTCVAPILDENGQFIGMVGFDTLVSSLNNIIENAKVFDTGYLSLIAPDGTIAYHPDSELEGINITEAFSQKMVDSINRTYNSDILTVLTSKDTYNKKNSKYTMAPIEVGLSGGKWIVATCVSLSELNKTGNLSIFIAIIIGIVITVLITLLLNQIIKKNILEPVHTIQLATQEMAKGSLNVKISYQADDELGEVVSNIISTSQKMVLYIEDIAKTLGEISKGNMAIPFDLEYIGDFIPIQSSMQEIVHYLNDTLRHIRESADLVANGSGQVAGSSQTLSEGTTEQASSVEELVAITNEISKQIADNSINAKQANKKADTVGIETAESNKRMQDLLEAMSKINQSSKEIEKIMKTIEDITVQTNILSLNAAVEAARAGESGRGFAVVAQEIQNLASQSKEASQKTAALIKTSQEAVMNGTKIADQTAQSLIIVMDGTKEVAATIDKISDACSQQAEFITQIVHGAEQISDVVQSNSASAQESAAVSEELSSQAQMLKNLVGKFKLRERE